jgi:hypothetical protein
MAEDEVLDPVAKNTVAKAAEEARLAAQTDFDPKLHGVGTHPAVGPKSVTELHRLHLELVALYEDLKARVEALEG